MSKAMIELVNLAGAGAPTKRISKIEIQQAMQVGAFKERIT